MEVTNQLLHGWGVVLASGRRSDIVSDVVPSNLSGEADAFFAGRVATLGRFCGVFVVVFS